MNNTARKTLTPLNMVYAAMFAALMGIGANITAMITIGTIPLTMQTFFAVLAGILLGSRIGSLSMILYTILGLLGLPVFSHFSGGLGYIFVPTFGFVLSFIFVAYITGKIIEMKGQPKAARFFIASFIGLFINYFIGTNIMFIAANTWIGLDGWSYTYTWGLMLPFLPKDIVCTIIAAIVSPRIYHAIRAKSLSVAPSAK